MAIDKEKIINGALKFIQKGQLDKALKEYQKILDVDPNDVRVLLRVAELHARRGDSKAAVDTYMKVAEQYTNQGFFLKAVAVYKNILKIDENRLEAYEKLAELYMQLGLTNDAMAQYGVLCDIHEKAGRNREMLDTLKKMLDLDPNDVLSRVKLGEMYAREGHNEDAATELLTATRALKSLGRLDEYVKVSERYFSIKPDDVDVGTELAAISLERREPKPALQKLQACYKAAPRNPRVLELLAEAFGQLDMPQNQVPAYKELLKVYREAGRHSEAEVIQNRLRTLMPEGGTSPGATAPSGEVSFPKSAEFPRPPPSGTYPAAAEPVHATRPAAPAPAPVSAPVKAARPAPAPVSAPVSASRPAAPAAGAKSADQISRLLTETDVYLKYGLKPRALDHLTQILSLDPDNIEAHQKLRTIHESNGDTERAAGEMFAIANILLKQNQVDEAKAVLLDVIAVRPSHQKAAALLDALAGTGGGVPPEEEPVAALEEVVEEPERGPHAAPEVIELPPPTEVDDDFDIVVTETRHRDSMVGRAPAVEKVSLDIAPEKLVIEAPAVPAAAAPEKAKAPATAPAPAAGGDDGGDLEADLEEAAFFLEQGLFDEARDTCQRILEGAPGNVQALDLLRKIDIKEKGIAPAPVQADKVEELSEVLDEVSAEPDKASGQLALQEIISEFKKGISETIDPRDAKSHFDLGCAYREMGLNEDAINEFKMAMVDEKMELTALHMIALCHIAKGEYERGISALKKALYYDEITEAQRTDFLYEIGIAYSRLDDPGEALYYLRKVAKKDPNYRALADHIHKVEASEPHAKPVRSGSEPQKQGGSGGGNAPPSAAPAAPSTSSGPSSPPSPAPSKGDAGRKAEEQPAIPGNPKKKISYL